MLDIDRTVPENADSLLRSKAEEPTPFRNYIRFSLFAVLLWIVLGWILSGRYVDWQSTQFLNDARQRISNNATDIVVGLEQNLTVFHGVPAIIGRDERVRSVLAGAVLDSRQKSLEVAERKAVWSSITELSVVNALLAQSVNDVPAFSIVWLIDAEGDCIAASNAGTQTTFVGSNFADREYFQAAKNGRDGRQFAVGRVTGIPGFFFSAPVFSGKQFLGVVAVKIELPYLATWVDQSNAFINDVNGVIILAQDKAMVMRSMPMAKVNQLNPQERLERYRQLNFPEIVINAWSEAGPADLFQLNGGDMPHLMQTRSIPLEDISVTVLLPVPKIATQEQDRINIFAVATMFGVLLIGIAAGTLYYATNFQRVRRYREYQRQIEYMASHDALTGLFSRAVIDRLICQGIATAARTRRRMGVLFLDMDMFKDINDSMGHDAGDLVLREVAQRLRSNLRASDSVIRHGGDEFVILLHDLESAENAAQLTSKLLEALHMPFVLQGVTLNLSASVGIALCPDDGETAQLLLSNADSALYRVKASGRSDFSFYHASMNADTMAHLALENELRVALVEDQFVLHYQPQYSLLERRVVGCEALIRWQHPERGLLFPAEFLVVAEKSSLIVALGDWVLRKACTQAAAWRQAGLIDFPVAVNLSAIQFRKPGLVSTIQCALAEAGLPAQGLEFELTESAMMFNTEETILTMQSLKALGVSLSIDDFGTGYSSLAYLKRYAPNVLKIDRSFVHDVENDANDISIINAIIGLGKSLNYRVIAEGVETESQMQLLEKMGCHEIQGYWFSRPLNIVDFSDFMKNRLHNASPDSLALPDSKAQ